MKFVYTPEGLEPKEWEFEPTKLMSPEIMAIEKLTGLTLNEWQVSIKRGSVTAIHAFLWVLLKRENPTLTPKQVQFSPSEVDFMPGDDEARVVLDHFATLPADEWDDNDREAVAELREKFPHVAALVDAASEADDEVDLALEDAPEGEAAPKDPA